MAVQQITQGRAQSRVPIYYVDPPDGMANMMAAYGHGYHQTRSKWTYQLFLDDLKRMNPEAQMAAIQEEIAAVQKEMGRRSDMQASRSESQLEAWKIQMEGVNQYRRSAAQVQSAAISAQGTVESARLGNETKRMEQQELPEQHREKVFDLKTLYQAAIDAKDYSAASGHLTAMMRTLGKDPTPRMAETGEWLRLAEASGAPAQTLEKYGELALAYGAHPSMMQSTHVDANPVGGRFTAAGIDQTTIDNLTGSLDEAISGGVPQTGSTSTRTSTSSRAPVGEDSPSSSATRTMESRPERDGPADTRTTMEYNVSPDADYDARLRQRLEGLFSEASQIRRGYKPRDPYAPWVPKKSPAENALEYQRKSEEYRSPSTTRTWTS